MLKKGQQMHLFLAFIYNNNKKSDKSDETELNLFNQNINLTMGFTFLTGSECNRYV